jgi:hypothetical protein
MSVQANNLEPADSVTIEEAFNILYPSTKPLAAAGRLNRAIVDDEAGVWANGEKLDLSGFDFERHLDIVACKNKDGHWTAKMNMRVAIENFFATTWTMSRSEVTALLEETRPHKAELTTLLANIERQSAQVTALLEETDPQKAEIAALWAETKRQKARITTLLAKTKPQKHAGGAPREYEHDEIRAVAVIALAKFFRKGAGAGAIPDNYSGNDLAKDVREILGDRSPGNTLLGEILNPLLQRLKLRLKADR